MKFIADKFDLPDDQRQNAYDIQSSSSEDSCCFL